MPESLRNLESTIGYYFKDQKILKEAMTHGSSRNQNLTLPHHERLEFLGDAVLATVISEYLFHSEPKATPGQLTERRKRYISDDKQNMIAERIRISRFVDMASSVRGFNRYGEFIEALIGAVYLDAGGSEGQGTKKAKEVIFRLWELQTPPQSGCAIF